MPIENKFERVEENDPTRCQAVGARGQCPYRACMDSKYCPRHGGNKAQESVREENKRMYQLAKYQARVGEFAEHEGVKSLREEIGIARMLLEEIVKKCGDGNELIMFSGKIADLVSRIEKLVVSCNRLEQSAGMMLDKSAALHLGSVIVEIIGRHVNDPDLLEAITHEIVQAIAEQQPEIKKDKKT